MVTESFNSSPIQTRKPPAHDAVRRRDRPGLEDLGKPGALFVIQDRRPPRRLAGRQPLRTIFVESQEPVAHDLKRDPGKLRRPAPTPAVQDMCDSQSRRT